MSDIRNQADLIPGLALRSKKRPDIAPGLLGEKLLSQLALRYAGDNGHTVNGTANAMAWMQQVRQLKPGQCVDLPGVAYEVFRDESV